MCDKKSFATKKAAQRSRIKRFSGRSRAYLCEECHQYHLTTQNASAGGVKRRPRNHRDY